ncbi:MAG: hypothetical protein HJJLKODD_02129 [Phycisphaerae bacterium]|nr:hypothetical protein [Phycisphaerae bacterium]
MEKCKSILVFGYGNPGRQDDGLGPALAAMVADWNCPGVTVDCDYQLNIEDAATVAEHDGVIFADAAVNGPEPFAFQEILPFYQPTFTTHHQEAAGVLALAAQLFNKKVPGYLLAIRGYDFNEFGESLSAAAQLNLQQAATFLRQFIQNQAAGEPVGCTAAQLFKDRA